MTKKLQHLFALSEKGAKDLVKAVIWCFVCNLSLMFPVGAVLFTVQHLLDSMENGGSPMDDFWIYAGFGIAVLILLFILHWFQYASLYLATYKESANRRVSLAETLRRGARGARRLAAHDGALRLRRVRQHRAHTRLRADHRLSLIHIYPRWAFSPRPSPVRSPLREASARRRRGRGSGRGDLPSRTT